jgi:hypothetical protein
MEISRIRYQYGEDTKTQYLAEEWITDEHAYNKKRGRLLHGSDKFRMKTIDLVDDLEKLTREALQVPGDRDAAPRVIPPREEPLAPAAIPATREGYQRILPTEINGNFINMLINGSLTLSGATGKPGVTTRWGGIGYLFDRPVVYCFAPRAGEDDRPGENYTLLWTPAGQGQSLYREVLFECRTLLAQPLALDAAAGWGDKPLPYFYTGEIIAIWIK